VAFARATSRLIAAGDLARSPLSGAVAAVSCGVVDGASLLDLDYSEDSRAEVDANVVMTGDGGLVEVQATAERTPLTRASLDELLALAAGAIAQLRTLQTPQSQRPWPSSGPPSTATDAADPRDAQRAQLREFRRLLS